MVNKILTVFYSRTGCNRELSQEISSLLKADVGEILPQINYSGFLGFLKGGFHSLRKKQIKISSPKNPSDYQWVILVGPVWAGGLCPALRSYVSNNNLKKFAFFSCNGNGKAQKSLEQLRELGKIPIETGFVSEKDFKANMHHQTIIEFCDSLKKQMKKTKKT